MWNPILLDAVAGALSEAACIFALYPIDTIKSRRQKCNDTASLAAESALLKQPLTAPASAALSMSAANGGVRTLVERRPPHAKQRRSLPAQVRDLYPGVGAAVMSSMVFGSIYMVMYELTKTKLERFIPKDASWVSVTLATIVGNSVLSLFEAPLDTIKQRLQTGLVSGPAKLNFLSAMRWTIRNQGLASLYVGYFPYVAKTVPFEITEFVVYEWLRDMRIFNQPALVATGALDQHGRWNSAVIGATVGLVATMLTMPVDCIKTYVNTLSRSGAGKRNSMQLTAFAAVSIWRKRGFAGFFRGSLPRLALHVPSAVVYFVILESMRRVKEETIAEASRVESNRVGEH